MDGFITKQLDGAGFELLLGYPPAAVSMPSDLSEPLEPQLRSGESIVVKVKASAPTPAPAPAPVAPTPVAPTPVASAPAPSTAAPAFDDTGGSGGEQFVRRVVPSDNSCLFNAVAHLLEGGRKDRAPALREVVASAVLADGESYCEAVLGQPPAKYAEWIRKSEHWGGGIELAVLAQHYKTELAAFDIQSMRVDTFGSGNGYSQRAFLLYDGIHYDACVKSLFAGAPEELDLSLFESSDELAMAGVRELVAAQNKLRKFTDTANFALRCLVCQKGLTGEKDALEHAKATGHQNFGEYSRDQ